VVFLRHDQLCTANLDQMFPAAALSSSFQCDQQLSSCEFVTHGAGQELRAEAAVLCCQCLFYTAISHQVAQVPD
jgi:hypothetical protein